MTFSGQAAKITLGARKPYTSGYDFTISPPQPQHATVHVGTQLEVEPILDADAKNVTLALGFQYTWDPKVTTLPVEAPGGGGEKVEIERIELKAAGLTTCLIVPIGGTRKLKIDGSSFGKEFRLIIGVDLVKE